MTKTHTVVYKQKFQATQEILDYHKNSNKAASVMTEFFLNIFGGIKENTIQNAIYDTSTKVNQEEEKIDANREKRSVNKSSNFPNPVILFYNWFTLEDISGVDESIAISIEDVIPRFKEYLIQDGMKIDQKWFDCLNATVKSAIFIENEGTQKSQDRTWVDRRLGHSKLINQIKIRPETIDYILKNPDFPLQKKPVDSHSFCGAFFSNMFGKGNKSDFSKSRNKIESLKNFIENNPCENLHSSCCNFLGIANNLEPHDINKKIFGKQGRPSKLVNYLGNKIEPLTKKDVLGFIKDQLGKNDYRLSQPNDPNVNNIVEYLKKEIKLPYVREYYVEFASMAIERIKSHRKNSLNMIARRSKLERNLPNIPQWLLQPINNWCISKKQKIHGREQTYLSDGDINKKIIKTIKESFTGNYIGTINLIEKNYRNKRNNFAFLKMIANLLDQNNSSIIMLDDLLEYQEKTKNQFDFVRFRSPRLARFINLPNHPQFGNSRPNAKYISSSGNIHKYEISILTSNGAKNIEINTGNKRASRDLLSNNIMDGKQVARRNNLVVIDEDTNFASLIPMLKNKTTISSNSGIKLVVRDNKSYLYVNFALPIKKCLKIDDIKRLEVGWKFMSFDPGIRNNITFCIGEVIQPKYKTPYKDDKDRYCIPIQNTEKAIRIIEVGTLKEEDFKRNDKVAITTRLEYESSSKNTILEAQNLFTELKNAKLVDGECPTKMPVFIKSVISAIKYYAKKEEKPDFKWLLDLTNILKYNSWNTGHLSYIRIINLKDLKSLYQLYQKKNPQILWIEDSLNYITKKIFNVREERVRRITNLVCQKALKHKVKVVFPENTTLDVHFKSSKWMMKRVDIWTPKKLLEQCQKQLNPFGIFVRNVVSDYSSHYDFSNFDKMKPRWDNLSINEIREEIKYYSSLINVGSKSTNELYRNEIESYLGKNGYSWNNWEEMKVKPDLFPRKGGKYYFSDLAGKIGSDENAAMYLLIKGILDLFEINRKTKKLNSLHRVDG